MKDFDSWIYVVIMIIFSIIGSISKKKKERALEDALPSNSEEIEEFEEIESPIPVNNPILRVKKESAPTPAFLNVDLNETIQRTTTTQINDFKNLSNDNPEQFVVNLDNNEEIRKAFIYSEIFNRKY